jgi:hypothetical protein
MVIVPSEDGGSDKTTPTVSFSHRYQASTKTAPERGHKNSNVALSKTSLYEGDWADWASSLFFMFVSLCSYVCVI